VHRCISIARSVVDGRSSKRSMKAIHSTHGIQTEAKTLTVLLALRTKRQGAGRSLRSRRLPVMHLSLSTK
jgi:hypothetical protein